MLLLRVTKYVPSQHISSQKDLLFNFFSNFSFNKYEEATR